MTSILIETEKACYNLAQQTLVSASLTASVYMGIDNNEKQAPAVIVQAENAERLYKEMDIWKVKTNIIVGELAADTDRSNIGILANTIFDAFLNVSASLNLTSATTGSFTCYDIIQPDYVNSTEQDAWLQMVSFTTICCPSK